MSRIFSVLVIAAMTLLIVNFGLGLWTSTYGEAVTDAFIAARELKQTPPESEAQEKRTTLETRIEADKQEIARLRPRVVMHTLVGIAAALAMILVNSVSVTYFIGTSRWCREVVDAYKLDSSLVEAGLRLKRRAFPWSVVGMLTVLVLVGLGGISDPFTFADPEHNPARHLTWRMYHFLFAMTSLVVLGYSFWFQLRLVAENYRVIDTIMGQVRDMRRARGLDVGAGE